MSLLHTFCQETKADYSQFIPALFRGIIHLMNDSDELVVDMSWNALNAVTKVTSLLPVSSNSKVLLKEVLGLHLVTTLELFFEHGPQPNLTEVKVLQAEQTEY